MSDPWRFTAIAHRRHLLLNPLSDAAVDRTLDSLEVGAGDRVLDVGCGPAEMLIRLIERRGVSAVGVDPNPHFIEEARRRATVRGVMDRLELRHREFSESEGEQFDAALCIGATHAFGGYRGTLRALARIVRPGGVIAVGHGYWMREPDREYLAALEAIPTGREIPDVLADPGIEATLAEIRNEMESHAANGATVGEEGLTLLGSEVASEADWHGYEDLYARGIEDWVRDHPQDPDTAAMARRIDRWREAVARWGRNTMGFAVYRVRIGG